MSAYPGHHAIAVKHARALATHYRAYDDTEDLVGVLVEMANIIDDLPERDRQVAERAWDEGQKAGLLRADFEYGAIGYQHVRDNPHRKGQGDE